jgi:F-box-like
MISNLPPEIWSLILRNLDRDDLLEVNAVCRNLQKLAEPVIYSAVDYCGGVLSYRRLCYLFRSIIHRPELALHVKRAHLVVGSSFPEAARHNDSHELDFGDGDIQAAFGLIRRDVLPPQPGLEIDAGFVLADWEGELRRGAPDVLVAVLLSQFSNLINLQLELDFEGESRPFVGTVFQQGLTYSNRSAGHSSFRSLRSLRVSINLSSRALLDPFLCGWQQLALLLNPPSLEALDILNFKPSHFKSENRTKLPLAAKLRILTFSESNMADTMFGDVLAATPGLNHFEWDMYHDPQDMVIRRLPELGSALSKLQNTLESIYLEIGLGSSRRDTFSMDVTRPLGSLKGFIKLRYVLLLYRVLLRGYKLSNE